MYLGFHLLPTLLCDYDVWTANPGKLSAPTPQALTALTLYRHNWPRRARHMDMTRGVSGLPYLMDVIASKSTNVNTSL